MDLDPITEKAPVLSIANPALHTSREAKAEKTGPQPAQLG